MKATAVMRDLILATVLWTVAGEAVADVQSVQLHSYKHWTVEYAYSDEGDGWNACTMQNGDGRLSLSLNVNGNGESEIQIYDSNADFDSWTDGSIFQVEVDSNGRWDMPADGIGNSLFVTMHSQSNEENVEQFIYELRQGLKLYVYEKDMTSENYWFSLSGSKAATDSMVNDCLQYLKPFAVAPYEPEALPVPGAQDPNAWSPSANYELQLEDTFAGKVLRFRGQITEGFAEDVMSYGNFDYLLIERSDGGLISEALAAGTYLRRNGVATYLDGTCASACVELYAGGTRRYHSDKALFGIHAMAIDGDMTSLTMTQVLLSDRANYFEAGGVDPRIVIESLDTPADEMRWLSIAEAQVYGLIGPS
jgi:hypothetical protein